MAPTLLPGDRLLVDLGAYRVERPAVGDIVTLVDPEEAGRWLIKRVAGVGPGRFWRTRSGLAAAPTDPREPVPPPDAIELVTLPDATVYVTGDAPSARDSRRFGAVPLGALVGRAYFRYAPIDRRREL
jgi:signal peptidase I